MTDVVQYLNSMKLGKYVYPAEERKRRAGHASKYNKRDEQNSWKELPPNKANGNQKSLGHLKGAKTIAQ